MYKMQASKEDPKGTVLKMQTKLNMEKKIESKEVAVIKGQLTKLEKQANDVKIESAEDNVKAIDLRAQLKEAGSKIKNTKESITKPLNEALKNARELFKPVEELYEKAESIIAGKLLAYNQKIREEAAKEEARIAADLEKGKIKKLETAERRIENIERVENTTHGNIGKAQVRAIQKVRIINEALLPREYLEPNNVAIRRDALGGKSIPGVEVYTEEIMV